MAITSLANTMWRIKNIDSYGGKDGVIAHIKCHYELRTISNVIYTDMTGFSFSKETLLGHQNDNFKPLPYATQISVGDKIKFLGNEATDTSLISSGLINWFTANATPIDQKEYEKLNPPQVGCAIDFDYELTQNDCHWNLDRYFRLTFRVFDPNVASKKELYYRVVNPEENIEGKTVSEIYTRIYASDPNLFDVGNNTWIYHLRVSDLGQQIIIDNRDSEGNLTVEALIRTTADNAVIETFSQYVELPPTLAVTKTDSELTNIATDYVKSNPGEFLCTWDPATIADCEANDVSGVDSVDGYSIEIFYKLKDEDNFVQLKGIKWNEEELAKGNYKLIKDPTYEEPEFTESPDLTKDFSLKSQHTRSEVRIEGRTENGIEFPPITEQFYFIPKTLGILPGSSYQIRIYPYSHYEGALISTQGTDSNVIDVPKGIVWVKTTNGWVEGQVWVMTESGWKNAEVIYTKTAAGWQEAQ